MLAALLLSLLIAQDAGAKTPDERRVAIARECHIDPDRLTVGKSDFGGYDVLTLTGAAPLSDAQMRCYGDALAAGDALYPVIEDSALGDQYARITEADQIANDRAERRRAREQLRRLGLLHRLPRFDPRHERLTGFAVQLERLCGAKPHSALVAVRGNIEVTQAALRRGVAHFNRIDCAVHAATASGYQVFGAPVPIPTPVAPIMPVREIEPHLELPAAKPL